MRYIGCCFSLLALVGCGSLGDLTGYFQGQNGQAIDPRIAQLLQNSAPQMQLDFVEGEGTGFLILDTMRDGVGSWISADGATLHIEAGIVRGTRGFGADILASDIDETKVAVLSGQTLRTSRFMSLLTGNDIAETHSYLCDVSRRGDRDIQLATGTVATYLMEENCVSLDQQFINLYWVNNASGNIVQSRQWMGPSVGMIILRDVQ